LKYLNKNQIALGTKIEIITKEEFDQSLKIRIENQELIISNKIASNLFVRVV